jgi:hypothetical protein
MRSQARELFKVRFKHLYIPKNWNFKTYSVVDENDSHYKIGNTWIPKGHVWKIDENKEKKIVSFGNEDKVSRKTAIETTTSFIDKEKPTAMKLLVWQIENNIIKNDSLAMFELESYHTSLLEDEDAYGASIVKHCIEIVKNRM